MQALSDQKTHLSGTDEKPQCHLNVGVDLRINVSLLVIPRKI